MKKLLLLTCLLVSFNTFADEVCLNILKCDYVSGTCTVPKGWSLNPYNAYEKFDKIEVPVSSISAIAMGSPDTVWNYQCNYKYGDHSFFQLTKMVSKLTGPSWSYSGFANMYATCTDISNLNNCSYIQ